MDTRTHDELSIMLEEEYDDISVAESLASETQRDPEQTVQVFSFSSLSFVFDSFSRISSLFLLNRVRMYDDESSFLSIATMSLLSTPVVRACSELP